MRLQCMNMIIVTLGIKMVNMLAIICFYGSAAFGSKTIFSLPNH